MTYQATTLRNTRDAAKLERFQSALQRAAFALTQTKMIVSVERTNAQTSESTGHNRMAIAINLPEAEVDSPVFVRTVLSLFYHGLAHVWFTPNMQNNVSDWETANLLEDMRIESFAVAIFPALAGYYRSAFAHMILDNPNAWEMGFLYASGRRFLDPKIVDSLRAVFRYRHNADAIVAVMDSYKRLHTADLTVRRVNRHIAELKALINNDTPKDLHNGNTQIGQANEEYTEDAQALIDEGADKFDELQDYTDKGKTNKVEETEDGPEDTDSDDGAGSDESASDEGDQADSGADDGSGDADATGDDSDAATDESGADAGTSDDDGSDDPGVASTKDTGAAKGTGKGEANDPRDVRAMLNDLKKALQESYDSEATDLNDVGNYIESMSGGSKIDDSHKERTYGALPVATVEMAENANSFAQRMGLYLSADIDPGWDRDQSSGRINAVRFTMGGIEDYDTAFDRWDEGRSDAFQITAGILIDRSPSMDSHLRDDWRELSNIQQAAQAAWVIRRGLETHNGVVRTCVYSSGQDYKYIYGDDPVGPTYIVPATNGLTDPRLAIADISLWLRSRSVQENRILFVLTDGAWSNENVNDALLQELMDSGVMVVMVYYDFDPTYSDHHPAHLTAVVNTGDDFVKLASDVVDNIYRAVSVGRR